QALEMFADLHRQFPAQRDYALALAKSHLRKGAYLYFGNQTTAAESEFEAARALIQPLVMTSTENVETVKQLEFCHANLARIHGDRREWNRAIKANREALDLEEALVQANPKRDDLQNDAAQTHTNLAIVLKHSGDDAGAARHFGEALQIHK